MTTKTYELPDGGRFEMPRPSIATMNSAAFRHGFIPAHAVIQDAVKALAQVQADETLSEIGKAQRADEIAPRAWQALADAHQALANADAATDAKEAELLAIPELAPGASATAAEDAEARAWWRAQSRQERAKILAALESDAEQAAKYRRLELALLRSPVPLPDADAQAVRALWERGRRLDDPGRALEIDAARDAATWVRRGLGHLQGHAARVTNWDSKRLADFLTADDDRAKVADALGIDGHTMAVAKAHKAQLGAY